MTSPLHNGVRSEPGGWLAERLDRAYTALDNMSSALWWNVAAAWGWEHPARWLRNMSRLAVLRGESHPQLAEVAEKLLAIAHDPSAAIDYTRSHIGPYSDGELLMGLLTRFECAQDQRFLEGAAVLGRKIAAEWRQTPHYYKAIPIGYLVALTQHTGDPVFLGAAVDIAREQELLAMRVDATHGAAAAMIFDGYLRLAEATGDTRYRAWALEGWQGMRERMMVTGGIGEHLVFQAPPAESDLHDETCQTAWWTILNLDFGHLTSEGAYYDLAERIVLNHLLFQQIHRGDGGFCACGDIDQGFRGEHNYFCCDNEGTYALLRVLDGIYTVVQEQPALRVNLFIDSAAQFTLNDGTMVSVRQATPYPRRGFTRLNIQTSRSVHLNLRIRIPGWARHAALRIDGQDAAARPERGYLCVDRTWAGHTALEVSFPMAMHIEADNSGKGAIPARILLDGKATEARRVGVLYGPVVAAIFRLAHGADLSWIWTGDYPEILDSGGSITEGLPGSRPDLLENGTTTLHSGRLPDDFQATALDGVPRLTWSARLGDLRIENEVRVLPGLPVVLEYRQALRDWNGQGRILAGGLRFATVKSHRNLRYSSKPHTWLYPFPVVTTKPDLADCRDLPFQAGTFGLTEQLLDGAALNNTGTVYLNNGFFRAICLFDPASVRQVTCRRTPEWVGVYFEPIFRSNGEAILVRRLVFPLFANPQNQTTVRRNRERMTAATVQVIAAKDRPRRVEIAGPALTDATVLIARQTGLRAGMILVSRSMASEVLDFDRDHVLVQCDVPSVCEVIAAPDRKSQL